MREHKYKVLDKSSQEFISDNGLTLKEIQNINNLDHFEFHEYTGLKDKNGVEIYDSDGVKNEFGDIFIVNHFDYPLMSLLITMELEIIVNIYENPELL